jgi:hypothetical protein
MWDLFFAFLLVVAGAVMAIYELRQWMATKRWAHLGVVAVAILSELSVVIGLMESLVALMLAVVLWTVVNNRK